MNQQRQAEWSLVTLSKVNLPDNASAEFCSAVFVNCDVSFQIMSWTISFYAKIVQSRLYVQVFQVSSVLQKIATGDYVVCNICCEKGQYLRDSLRKAPVRKRSGKPNLSNFAKHLSETSHHVAILDKIMEERRAEAKAQKEEAEKKVRIGHTNFCLIK